MVENTIQGLDIRPGSGRAACTLCGQATSQKNCKHYRNQLSTPVLTPKVLINDLTSFICPSFWVFDIACCRSQLRHCVRGRDQVARSIQSVFLVARWHGWARGHKRGEGILTWGAIGRGERWLHEGACKIGKRIGRLASKRPKLYLFRGRNVAFTKAVS